jgi:hypothetical protein
MKNLFLFLFAVSFVGWGITRKVMSIQFDKNCTGYLKRAGDANNVTVASIELKKAIAYIESNNLTDGNTGIIYQIPKEDLGFWYKNLKSAQENLEKLDADTTLSSLEESNALLKLRETIIDHGDKGDKVTVPPGISVFPANLLFAVWGFISLMGLSFFLGTASKG